MSIRRWLDEHLGLSVALERPASAEELSFSRMVPYLTHYDDFTIITKDNALLTTVRLDGIYADALTREQIRNFEHRRNTMWRAIADPTITVYSHLIRRKVSNFPEGEGHAYFSKFFNARWRENFEKNPFFSNELYITLVVARPRRVTNFWERFRTADDNADPFEDQATLLEEATAKLLQSLAEYGARRLRIQRLPRWTRTRVSRAETFDALQRFRLGREEFIVRYGDQQNYDAQDVTAHLGQEFSETESFLFYLTNLRECKVPLSKSPIDKRLAASYTTFLGLRGGQVEVEGGGTRRLGAFLSMSEWPEKTSPMQLDDFLTTPGEIIITQSFSFVDRLASDMEIQRKARQMRANDAETNEENLAELKNARRDLLAGRAVDGFHHLSVLVHISTPADIASEAAARETMQRLNEDVARVDRAFLKLGVKSVREKIGTETFFWSQLPGQNPGYIGRRGRISSENYAGFVSLHNHAPGRADGNLWGPAIMPFPTTAGTAYNFNFHRETDGMVAGHTAVTADTGSGKTALVAALIAMADKAENKDGGKLRVFWFDNRQGALVFMKAMGGRHYTLSPRDQMGWNPCLLPDTPDNRLYLRDLLEMMATYTGRALDAADHERLQHAVNENYTFTDLNDRRLRNIAHAFGNGELARIMSLWYGSGELAGIFDNAQDSIDFTTCRHYCFEMMQLIVDGNARKELPIMLSYLMHRITLAMNGDPFIIVLDEGQNLVVHEIWRQKIDALIMQIRRKNGILIFITPDPRYLYDPCPSIRKQSATLLLLPNKQAKREDYVDPGLTTDEEFRWLAGEAGSREFLIKRGGESIRAEFDLGKGLSDFIPILSGNNKSVALMNEAIAEVGDDPSLWVPLLMERAMAANTHNLRLVA